MFKDKSKSFTNIHQSINEYSQCNGFHALVITKGNLHFIKFGMMTLFKTLHSVLDVKGLVLGEIKYLN